MLPWREWTTFAILTSIVAALHGVTALLALVGHRLRGPAWRVQALGSLTYFAYLTWNLLTSATYIAELYGGLGRGVAVSLGLVWIIVFALTIPLSAWGLAVTGGVRLTKAGRAGAVIGLLLLGLGLFRARQAAAAEPVLGGLQTDTVASALRDGLPEPRTFTEPPGKAPSLMVDTAVRCEAPPGPERATVVAAHLAPGIAERPTAIIGCWQGDSLDAAISSMREALQRDAYAGPLKIDVVTGVQPLRHVVPVVDSMTLRSGIDGVCEESTCLMPWQMLALDLFNSNVPIPVIPELRFGFDPVQIRKILMGPQRRGLMSPEIEGLTRIETASFVLDPDGTLHRLHRLRTAGPELTPETLEEGVRAAERYIMRAQGKDGRFEYKLDPFSGHVSYRGFSLPRQAGTTLVVCELSRDRKRAKKVAIKALEALARYERKVGDVSVLNRKASDPNLRKVRLGDTALASIAFLSCRDLVGDRFDPLIDRMTRFLLMMKRDNGSFHPELDLRSGQPIPGPDPLYAVGQGVFALTLLEKVVADPDVTGFADHAEVRDAVETAMEYTASDYWNNFASDFFFMEENWHCLAARASLGHHRHEAYEDFCLDYVRYKTRLILSEDDQVVTDLVGGYGFGNVLLPHNTGSAGFGEAMSAAMFIMQARGMSTQEAEAPLKRALAFLLHHQWNEPSCFACSADHSLVGGFSEHMGSPTIRIDYVQHAMAGMGHGGTAMGWLGDPRE